MSRKCQAVSLIENSETINQANNFHIKALLYTYSLYKEQIRWKMRFGSLVCAK